MIPAWPSDDFGVTVIQTWPTLRLRCDVCGAWWEVDNMAEVILLDGWRCPFSGRSQPDCFGLFDKAMEEGDAEMVEALTWESDN